jgi:hypothetical protein
MKAKYIIIDKVFPVIFHPGIEHKMEAAGRNVTSAGFCETVIVHDQFDRIRLRVYCSGESNSLGLGPKPSDAKLLKSMLLG